MKSNKIEPLCEMKHRFSFPTKSEDLCIGEMISNVFGNVFHLCSSEISGTKDSILHDSIITTEEESMASIICVTLHLTQSIGRQSISQKVCRGDSETNKRQRKDKVCS